MSSIYLYPMWLRIWHGINAILYLLLIASGLSLQYANPEYPWIRFDIAVSIHNISGILLTGNYLIIIIGNRFTKNGRFYRIPKKGFIKELIDQTVFYSYGIFKGADAPFPVNADRKFNPLQKVAYVAVLYFFMPLIFITGWLLIFPDVIPVVKILGTSMFHFTDLVHIIVGFILSIFLIVHVYLCTIGKPSGSHFKAMWTGWHHHED